MYSNEISSTAFALKTFQACITAAKRQFKLKAVFYALNVTNFQQPQYLFTSMYNIS